MAEYTMLEQAKIRLKQYHIETVDNADAVVFDRKEENPLIEQLIEQATKEVRVLRQYPTGYTSEMIANDVEQFANTIVNLSVYDYSQAGEAYMSSYSENGISRSWKNRDELLASVTPIAKII